MFIQIQTGTAAIIDLNLRRRQFQPETGIAVSSQICSAPSIYFNKLLQAKSDQASANIRSTALLPSLSVQYP